MHIGHFGSKTSSAPEPTHPLVRCHQLCWGRRPAWILQQFITPIEVVGFPPLYGEEANFRSLFNTMENMPYPRNQLNVLADFSYTVCATPSISA
jgi:hypothetical protein